MQSVWTLRGPGPDHAGPSVFTLYLVGSEKPLKNFKGVEGSWAGLHCEILPALTVAPLPPAPALLLDVVGTTQFSCTTS